MSKVICKSVLKPSVFFVVFGCVGYPLHQQLIKGLHNAPCNRTPEFWTYASATTAPGAAGAPLWTPRRHHLLLPPHTRPTHILQ